MAPMTIRLLHKYGNALLWYLRLKHLGAGNKCIQNIHVLCILCFFFCPAQSHYFWWWFLILNSFRYGNMISTLALSSKLACYLICLTPKAFENLDTCLTTKYFDSSTGSMGQITIKSISYLCCSVQTLQEKE